MASFIFLLLLLRLSSLSHAQVSNSTTSASASDIASSASEVASSASDAASSASSLSSVGSTSAASSAASAASSISSVASSLSSVASSASVEESTKNGLVPTSTATSPSSSSATDAESPSSTATPSTSSSSTTTEESTSSTFSPVTLESTSTSISFAPTSVLSVSVVPTTSNGVAGFSTLTTFVVSSAPAGTYTNVSPYTTSQLAPGPDPTTQAGASQSGGGGGLSTGAKIGIGVGVGLAVLLAAIFGGWYSWFMRKRRRRSISASDRYPPSSLPSMIHMGGGAGAALGYADKSDTRSELPSPPIGGPLGSGHPSPPLNKPNHLVPVGAGVRSWNSVSNSNAPASNISVSDYSERGGQPPHDPADNPITPAGYFPPAVPVGPVHEMGDNSQYKQQQTSPQQQYSHSRTISGTSQPSEIGDGSPNPNQRASALSGSTQQGSPQVGGGHYQSPSIGSDGYWHDTQQTQPQQPASELQGSAPYAQQQSGQRPVMGEGYRGVDPEVPLHQRMQTERVPVRPGHLRKDPPGLGPSHNY